MLDVADPDGDDNGPGTYQYPFVVESLTAGALNLGSAIIARPTATSVPLRATVRDLHAAFGLAVGRPASGTS